MSPQLLARTLAFAIGIAAFPAQADTIYLCRNFGGGEFWSNTHCNKQNAVILRMTNVPSGMSFNQQVDLARGAKADAERLTSQPMQQPQQTVTVTTTTTQSSNASQCAALAQRIQALDAQARQPNSAPTQDRIAAERRATRDQWFALRC